MASHEEAHHRIRAVIAYDLALIKLDGVGKMRLSKLTWNLDPISLHYNRPIRLLSSARPPAQQGLAIPISWGCAIGQAVWFLRARADWEDFPLAEIRFIQLSAKLEWFPPDDNKRLRGNQRIRVPELGVGAARRIRRRVRATRSPRVR